MFGAQNSQKFVASCLCAAVGVALFCARERQEATPHTPDSRQSRAALIVEVATTFPIVPQSFVSVPSQSEGSLHFSPDDCATLQNVAPSPSGSDLHAVVATRPANAVTKTARAKRFKLTTENL